MGKRKRCNSGNVSTGGSFSPTENIMSGRPFHPVVKSSEYWAFFKKAYIVIGVMLQACIAFAGDYMKALLGEGEFVGITILQIFATICVWAMVVNLCLVVGARRDGKDWWYQPKVLERNKKLLTAFDMLAGLLVALLICGINHCQNLGWGSLTVVVVTLLVDGFVMVALGFLTHCIVYEDP